LDLNQVFHTLFQVNQVLLLVVVGLEKGSMDRGFENFEGIMCPSCFELVAQLMQGF